MCGIFYLQYVCLFVFAAIAFYCIVPTLELPSFSKTNNLFVFINNNSLFSFAHVTVCPCFQNLSLTAHCIS